MKYLKRKKLYGKIIKLRYKYMIFEYFSPDFRALYRQNLIENEGYQNSFPLSLIKLIKNLLITLEKVYI
jgi:hypothetical protein